MRKEGLRLSIGGARIYRKTETPNGIYHYTTLVFERNEALPEGFYVDGFSLTDSYYVYWRARKAGMDIDVVRRLPHLYNAIFLVAHKGDYIMPYMSRCVLWTDEDVHKFYLRPLKIRPDDILVMDRQGKLHGFYDIEVSYMPDIKPRSYDHHPDVTIIVSDGEREVVFDVFTIFYVKVVTDDPYWGRLPEFMGYLDDLIALGIVPPIEVEHVRIDPWRVRHETKERRVETPYEWVRITDYEWCGWGSESSARLRDLWERVKENAGKGPYDIAAAVVHYTSNLFVVYVDIWLRGSKALKRVFEGELEELRKLQNWEILKSLFPALFD